MKKIILSLLLIAVMHASHCETVVTIGTGTSSQYYPFNMFGGYARSAAIYTASEIGMSGVITQLGWDVASSDLETCPVRIYLKLVPSGSLSPVAWQDLTATATLVFDGSAGFPATGWRTIDIADFVYSNNNGDNLLVLCEANYGGNGSTGYPFFSFSYAPGKHETWQQYETPPAFNGTPDDNRPNLSITLAPLNNPYPPSGFLATPTGATQVDLAWKKNSSGNNVMVAYNTVNVFGAPVGSYTPGSSISGGGTIIYNGAAQVFQHNTGLVPATQYYYRAWSVLPPLPAYSLGTAAQATTLCTTVVTYPYLRDFNTEPFPPVCWSVERKPWVRDGTVGAFGSGGGAIFADFFSVTAGNSFDLVLPVMDLGGVTFPVLCFDHAYATFGGETDQLQMWVSSDDGETWTLHHTWDGGLLGPLNTGGATSIFYIPQATEWASKSEPIPAGTTRIRLRGISAWGNTLYLDNIRIADQDLVWNGSVSTAWENPSNWTPNTVPGITRNVVIPSGLVFYPEIHLEGASCHDLLIDSGASFVIDSGYGVNCSGTLSIKNGATFINNGIIDIKGNLVNENP